MENYYLSGSHNKKYPSKAHIMNDDGLNLCGVKGYWIESSLKVVYSDGSIEGKQHLPNIFLTDVGCKKCYKKLKKLKGYENS